VLHVFCYLYRPSVSINSILVILFTFDSFSPNFVVIPSGADLERLGTPGACPLRIGKNMIFWHKIVIFHTKYPKNVRASLRSGQFFLSAPPPPYLKILDLPLTLSCISLDAACIHHRLALHGYIYRYVYACKNASIIMCLPMAR
jgi:hypothetical protein